MPNNLSFALKIPPNYRKLDTKAQADTTIKDASEKEVAKHYIDKGCEVYWNRDAENTAKSADFILICPKASGKKCIAIVEVGHKSKDVSTAHKQLQKTIDSLKNDGDFQKTDLACIHVAIYSKPGLKDAEKLNENKYKVTIKKKAIKIKNIKVLAKLPCCDGASERRTESESSELEDE